MSRIAKFMVIASVLSVVVADWSMAQGRRDASDATDVAIERKFSRPAGEQGTGDQTRSRMTAPQEAAKQGLLAQLLVLQTGLSRYLPLNPTDIQCFNVLSLYGIEPKEGWDPDKVVTRGDLARVIVLALEMGDQVQNPDDPRSWMDVLAAMNIQITTIGEAVQHVYPLSRRAPTNPFFAPASSAVGESVDGTELAFVLRNVFPPEPDRRVTPD